MKLADNTKKLPTRNVLFILLGVAAGILLLIYGSTRDTKSNGNSPRAPSAAEGEDYVVALEKKVAALLNGIDGVQNAAVMITLDSSSEYVYASDSTLRESSSDGKTSQKDASKELVLTNRSGSDQSPVMIKQISPKVKGIAVVCAGGSSPMVKSEIIGLLSTLFDLPTHKIFVSQ